MKTSRKIIATLMAAVLLVSVAGCSQSISLGSAKNEAWSYKSGDVTLPIGVYINYLKESYSSVVNSLEDTETEALTQTIKDDDGKDIKVSDKIIADAKEKCLEYFVINNQIKEIMGDKAPTQADIDKYISDYNSTMESFYAMYGYSYSADAVYSEVSAYGISPDSYDMCMGAGYLRDELFKAIYGKEGTKAVPDSEVEDYFLKNYTHYRTVTVSYTTTTHNEELDTDETTDLDDKSKAELKKEFEGYAKSVKSAEDFEKSVLAYMKGHSIESDPTASYTTIIDTDDEEKLNDVQKKVLELSDNTAAYIEDEEGKSATFIFRGKVSEYVDFFETEEATGDDAEKSSDTSADTNTDSAENEATPDDAEPTINEVTSGLSRDNLLYEYKKDEYDEYLKDLASKLDYQANTSEINRYSPDLFAQKG